MNKFSRLAVVLLVLLLACSESKKSVTKWPYGVNYKVFVMSYAIHNISDVEVTITLGEELKDFNEIDFESRTSVSLKDGELTVPAYSSIVLK